MNDTLRKCIKEKKTTYTPIWFMRQAGRYLPEFREIRKNNQDFIKLCLNPDLVSEITLQPLKRFDLDAAIIFSDILMVPYGLGQKVEFKKGFGPVLEEIKSERIKSTGKEGADIWTGFGTIELVWELGTRIGTKDSLIYWAAKNKIPVIIPGITDGSIGSQLFMFRQKNPEFTIDLMADEQHLSDLTWVTEKSNALMVGGGISKHHVIWWISYYFSQKVFVFFRYKRHICIITQIPFVVKFFTKI